MVSLHIYHYRFSLELLTSNDKPLKLALSAIGKKVGHIERKIDDAVFNLHILLVENERCVKVLCIFRPVFVKSRMVDFKGFDRSKSTRFQGIHKAEIYTFSNDSHYEALD